MMQGFIKTKEPLKKHCTLQIGGVADYFSEPETESEIISSLQFAIKNTLPYFIIGHGSNVLFDDLGYRGLIIKIGEKFSKIVINDNKIIAQAGAWMPYVARKCQVNGLAGLEHIIGIPGNIGGGVTMNAGSQRKSISERLIKVRALDHNGQIHELKRVDCDFGYRKSLFQKKGWIILTVELECERSNCKTIRHEMLKILQDRRDKFPRKQPNCGSVFKSSPELYKKHGPPGLIIENLGLKGSCVGGVCISQKHANFFVNINSGTSSDFKQLLCLVQDRFMKEHGYKLTEEVIKC